MKRTKGSGSVFRAHYRDRHGDRKESRTWSIAWTDLRGERHVESSGSERKADAEKLLRIRLEARDAGKQPISTIEGTTFENITEMITTDYRANGRRSLSRLLGSLKNLRTFFGDYRVVQITPDRIRAYITFRLEAKAAKATINRELAALKRALRLGKESGKVGEVPPIHLLAEDNARQGFFERAELEAVLENLPVYWRAAFEVAYITGWRVRSEILTREWRHVDFEHEWLRLEPVDAKNRSGRMFPLTPELRTVLERQRKATDDHERATGKIVPWVFHLEGKRLRDYRRAWAKARTTAAMPKKIAHDFRRTAVRNLERAGVPRSTAKAMVGHKTDSIYYRYAITDEVMLKEGAAKLSAFHQGSSTKRKVLPISQRQAKDDDRERGSGT